MLGTEIKSIGFIGLGNMGGGMAINLCKAKMDLSVYARNPDRLKPLVAAGASICESISDVAAKSDVVFMCLTDTAAVESVVFGSNGIADGAKPGSILVDNSTISPDATIQMAERLRKQCGMEWVDAPISGGSVGASDGTLSIFVGGRDADYAKLRPILSYVGNNITKMGPLGAGQTTKLINQIFVTCSVAMLAEAVGLAERVGLDLDVIPAALAGGRGDSVGLQNYWPRLAKKDYESLSTVTSILKDIDLLQKTADAAGAALPMTATAREYYQILSSAGFGGEDLTALARIFGSPVNLSQH